MLKCFEVKILQIWQIDYCEYIVERNSIKIWQNFEWENLVLSNVNVFQIICYIFSSKVKFTIFLIYM